MNSKRRLIISVDVEAQPPRAEKDHVDRLIWGRFPEATAGIGTMMDIAERHGVALTMFLDLCELELYGERITEVGREIVDRGHDLQLHTHPDMLQSQLCPQGIPNPPENLIRVSAVQADCLADFLVDSYFDIAGVQPIGFRGGGYRYNRLLLDALAKRGVVFDSSYNVGRPTNQPGLLGIRRQFTWENGILEIPISCVDNFQGTGKLVEFNFNTSYLPNITDLFEFLDGFYGQQGEDALAILVMHSWSLLFLDSTTGHFNRPVLANIDRLKGFLDGLSGAYEVLTLRDLYAQPTLCNELFSDRGEFGMLSQADRPALSSI